MFEERDLRLDLAAQVEDVQHQRRAAVQVDRQLVVVLGVDRQRHGLDPELAPLGPDGGADQLLEQTSGETLLPALCGLLAQMVEQPEEPGQREDVARSRGPALDFDAT
ncbi:hypothetical protein D3C75_941840 [compost metagenome]